MVCCERAINDGLDIAQTSKKDLNADKDISGVCLNEGFILGINGWNLSVQIKTTSENTDRMMSLRDSD